MKQQIIIDVMQQMSAAPRQCPDAETAKGFGIYITWL